MKSNELQVYCPECEKPLPEATISELIIGEYDNCVYCGADGDYMNKYSRAADLEYIFDQLNERIAKLEEKI